MPDFQPVVLSLPSLTPALAVEIIPYGLTVHRILVQSEGKTNDIVIAPEDPHDHKIQKYTNTAIGRYANRIPVGTHQLERNGIKSEFTAQPNENDKVSLHGGPVGYDSKVWTKLSDEEGESPVLFTEAERKHLPSPSTSHAFFRLVSEDGDQGYPGKVIVEALVALISPGEQQPGHENIGSVVFVYRAKLEGSQKTVTPVNLTQHWGFNLEASLEGNALLVHDHELMLQADHIVARDELSLSKGHFTDISKDPAHSHSPKLIGKHYPDVGYDDFYVFRTPTQPLLPTRFPLSSFTPELDLIKDVIEPTAQAPNPVQTGRAKPVAELASKKAGLRLVFDTNQAGCMFYSNYLAKPEKGARKKIHGGSGRNDKGDAYGPGTAVFLEFHNPLTAFLMPENKDKEDTLLTSEEMYNNYTRMDIKALKTA